MTTHEYHEQQAACNDLCNVTDDMLDEPNLMRCVTCPFCKETVDAKLTPETISCPACEVVVRR